MYIEIDHDRCQHADAYAHLCLAKTLRYPLGHERSCFARLLDDGEPSITVVLREDGEEHLRIFESEEELRAWAMEGSLAFA